MTDSVTLQTITRTAEKQFSRLSTDDQKKVLKKLKSPVPREQCTLVQNLRRFRVFHFSASETLRISFLRFQQRNCIVDIGIHPDFDRFAKNFRGCASQPISTLKDSPIMKNQTTKVVAPALAIAETKILHDTSRGSNNSAYGELMMDVLSQICQDVIQRQVSAQL
ncbi:MAG: hypothetical protein KDA84_02110 [Planctomycetaceae bacterium]|nr:hypothetical protein [Planctomycetaceae bacterium]